MRAKLLILVASVGLMAGCSSSAFWGNTCCPTTSVGCPSYASSCNNSCPQSNCGGCGFFGLFNNY